MTSPPNPAAPGPPEPPHAAAPRASDADRDAVVRVLHDAVARGLLSIEEGNERVGAALSARFVHELRPLTADLPPAPVLAPVAPGWRPLALLAWLQLRTALAGMSWRGGTRSRVRLAVATLLAVVVLSLVAASVGELFEHGHDDDHHSEQFDD